MHWIVREIVHYELDKGRDRLQALTNEKMNAEALRVLCHLDQRSEHRNADHYA